MNAHDLAQLMADNAPVIVEHLLPQGKKAAGEWKCGSVAGEPGQSLSVRLTGAKRGVWKDFSADIGGDLLDLWAQCRCLSIPQAMAEAKAFLGVREDRLEASRPAYKRPQKPQCHAPKSAVKAWLNARGLTDETIAAFRIGEQVRGDAAFAVFPYLRDGELINAKYRNVAEKRDMRQEGGAEPCLFGWHLIEPNARRIAIAEGEIDAMTLHQVGIPALSVNAGAGNHQWIDSDWERLERFSEILLCYDSDEAGQKGAREVANRLGIERCRVVTFDNAKDANEYLASGADGADFDHCIRKARPFDPDELRRMADFWPDLVEAFWPTSGERKAFPALRFAGRDEDWFEFRPGELTVWTGYSGHGKSLMLNQVLIGVMAQGERMCVFSGEMTPAEQCKRMARQLTGVERPSKEYLEAARQWIFDRAWLFNLVGSASIDRLLTVFSYGYKRYGIRHFVIDSLMMTDVPEDGAGAMSAQKEAMRKLASFCRQHNVHLHLVAHPRKSNSRGGEKEGPEKHDVAGSAKITDAADNVFSVWSAQKDDGEELDKPDGKLELHKQRNAADGAPQNRKLWLYFNPKTQQYSANSRRQGYHYVEFEADRSMGQMIAEAEEMGGLL